MADATRPTVQEAEMAAAEQALTEQAHRFEHMQAPVARRGGRFSGRRPMTSSHVNTQRGRGFAGVTPWRRRPVYVPQRPTPHRP